MKFETFSPDFPPSLDIMQLIRCTCPNCNQSVSFIMSEKDKEYRSEAEYWKKRFIDMNEKYKSLNETVKLLRLLMETNGKS